MKPPPEDPDTIFCIDCKFCKTDAEQGLICNKLEKKTFSVEDCEHFFPKNYLRSNKIENVVDNESPYNNFLFIFGLIIAIYVFILYVVNNLEATKKDIVLSLVLIVVTSAIIYFFIFYLKTKRKIPLANYKYEDTELMLLKLSNKILKKQGYEPIIEDAQLIFKAQGYFIRLITTSPKSLRMVVDHFYNIDSYNIYLEAIELANMAHWNRLSIKYFITEPSIVNEDQGSVSSYLDKSYINKPILEQDIEMFIDNLIESCHYFTYMLDDKNNPSK